MPKKYPKRELFTQAIERWKDRLWANDWVIDMYDAPDKLKRQGDNTGRGTLAEITPNVGYLWAKLYYDGAVLDSMADEDIDVAALHEVCHLITAPLVSLLGDVIDDVVPRGPDEVYGRWLKETNERVATHIERIARKGVKEWA